jgi:hypothetical protein
MQPHTYPLLPPHTLVSLASSSLPISSTHPLLSLIFHSLDGFSQSLFTTNPRLPLFHCSP